MFGAILKATNSSFQKGMIFFHSIYVKKVMKLLAFYMNSPRTIMSSSGSIMVHIVPCFQQLWPFVYENLPF